MQIKLKHLASQIKQSCELSEICTMSPPQHVNFQVWENMQLYNILLNYPNQLPVPKNSSGNIKKSKIKHENPRFQDFLIYINTFLLKL